jgi:hypothetical protein
MSVVYQTVVLYGWELPFGTIDPEITYDYNPRKVESSGQPVIISEGHLFQRQIQPVTVISHLIVHSN